MPGRATIHQVARELGVSASTVSRAFNAPHLLRPQTVARVAATAESMGYLPSRHAQALATGRTGLLGLVVPDITNPFFPPLVRAAQRTAEQHGFTVMLAETNSIADRERTHIASLARHCEGIIIASSRLTPQELRQAAEMTRLVLLNNDTDGLARVLVSSSEALTDGVRDLVRKGAQRFCYVGGPHRSWSEFERRTTLKQLARELHLGMAYLRDESGTYHEAREMMGAFDVLRTDAVIAFDDVVACGVLDGLSDRGVRIPEDLFLLGCDDALPVQTRPRLSTIRLRAAEGAAEAIRILMSPTREPVAEERVVLPGSLMLRETT